MNFLKKIKMMAGYGTFEEHKKYVSKRKDEFVRRGESLLHQFEHLMERVSDAPFYEEVQKSHAHFKEMIDKLRSLSDCKECDEEVHEEIVSMAKYIKDTMPPLLDQMQEWEENKLLQE